MRELNNIYKHIFLYVYAPYKKARREENNRSEYILDNNKTSKLIKHLTFPPNK